MRERDLQVLVEAMPYIRKFRDRLFIVKLGGELLEDPEHLSAVAGDITLARMVGIRVVVVHGGGPQASRMSTTIRSASPVDSSVTSSPNSCASDNTTAAEIGRLLFSIWFR